MSESLKKDIMKYVPEKDRERIQKEIEERKKNPKSEVKFHEPREVIWL